MQYRFKVSLEGKKGFFRIYVVDAGSTIYSFHKQMRADMDFPQDQQFMFKALDSAGAVVARYAIVDLGAGTVDKVTLADAVKAGAASFVYFYDVVNKKQVIVTLEEASEGPGPQIPVLVDSKGPNPIEFENGFVAFEDLPAEKRRVPSDEPSSKPSLASILFGSDAAGEEDEDDDEDEEDEEDDEEDDDEKDEEDEIYDENEENGF